MSYRFSSLPTEEIKKNLENGQSISDVKFVVFKNIYPNIWADSHIEFDTSEAAEEFVSKNPFDCDVAIMKKETSVVKLREKKEKKKRR